MQDVQLLFENSPWLIIVCLLAGVLYAGLLYYKSFRSKSWNSRINYLLSALRFVLVSVLCLLIIGPFVKQIKNNLEKPVVVFAVDNSASVQSVEDSARLIRFKEELARLSEEVQEKGYLTEYRSFESVQPLDSIRFDYASSDINGMLRSIAADYEGGNLASVVLLSDGIYNRGISPTYSPYSFTINTVGLGDTIPKQDININTLYYNKIAYQGNKFPVVAEIANTGFSGETVNVNISRQGKVLATKPVTFSSNRGVSSVEFLLDADREGMQHYVVEATAQEGEFTTQNNRADAYVEIIEGKEKILMLAQAPHPDVKAIKAAIENNKNYELQLVILSVDERVDAAKISEEKYDLVIFHQLPSRKNTSPLLNTYLEKPGSKWFIVGSQTDLQALNQYNNVLTISGAGSRDEVSAVYNQNFEGFQFSNASRAVLNSFLPISVPFGELSLKNGALTLLRQKIGSVASSKPLLVVGEQEASKTAVMLGEGMWQWRLQEYANHENTDVFNAFVTKLVQYLSAKEDKRRFKVYPVKDEFEDTEPVVLETEIYNDIYEPVYGSQIDLLVSNEEGEEKEYSYVTNPSNTQYRISNLPEGVYQYTASTSINGEKLSSKGSFTIRALQIESLNLTANHGLLRQLSEESGGTFVKQDNLQALAEQLEQQEAKGKIYTSEAYLPIINLKWLFFVLLLLVSAEWGIRKYLGSY